MFNQVPTLHLKPSMPNWKKLNTKKKAFETKTIPKALRTHILRFLGPKTLSSRAFGLL